jgi:formyltetrahydrofolate deformylase
MQRRVDTAGGGWTFAGMERLTLLLRCPDAPGIVADVTGWLAQRGANIIDAAQTTDADAGLFLQRIVFDTDHGRAETAAAFAAVAARWGMAWELHAATGPARMAVLVSRDGHCLYDLLGRCATGDLDAEIVTVISNHTDHAPAAERFAIPFHHVPVIGGDRSAQEAGVLDALDAASVDVVVLARYMRVLSPRFCEQYGPATINIHHSFLPAFIGADAYAQAHRRGVKLVGATAHYVTDGLDEGPIIAQDVIPVGPADTAEVMAGRGRDLEGSVLATAVRAHLEHRVLRYGNRTVVFA